MGSYWYGWIENDTIDRSIDVGCESGGFVDRDEGVGAAISVSGWVQVLCRVMGFFVLNACKYVTLNCSDINKRRERGDI